MWRVVRLGIRMWLYVRIASQRDWQGEDIAKIHGYFGDYVLECVPTEEGERR